MRVFVASTFEDLENYRAAATRAILTSGNISQDMLLWPAAESPPLDISLSQLRSCGLLILLIAHRYGEPPEGHNVSITELEFNEAVSRKIPVLAFNLDPAQPWLPKYMETDPVKLARLAAFKKAVDKRVTHTEFTTPESLEVAITHALTQFTERARHKSLPRYVQARAIQISRPESLTHSADSIVQIGHAPDGAPLLLSITRHIRVEEDLAAIAARLGKDPHDPVFKDILAQLNQEARTFAATTGIYDSAADGSTGKFYVPSEPLTNQVTPSLFQSMLAPGHPAMSAVTNPNAAYGPTPSPYAATPPAYNTGYAQSQYNPYSSGGPALNEHSQHSGLLYNRPAPTSSGTEPGAAEPKVISLGGMNRFLCVALDSSPTAWSGGWAVYPTGEYKLVIGRPFIEEGLERLPEVNYTIYSLRGPFSTNQPDLFIKKWAELLSSVDDAELWRLSYKITIPRSSIARFTLEVIDEVAGLHERGRIHADIKPSNILISRNGTLLIDDADLSIGDISPTVTPGWSSSEQLLRQPLSAAADIYSLGQLLVFVLAGEALGKEVRYRIPGGQMATTFDDPTVYIDSGNPCAPVDTREDWCRLIERALKTDPGERPTARAMADHMRALLAREDLRGEVDIRLPWGERPALILDANGKPTVGWVITSGGEKTLLGG